MSVLESKIPEVTVPTLPLFSSFFSLLDFLTFGAFGAAFVEAAFVALPVEAATFGAATFGAATFGFGPPPPCSSSSSSSPSSSPFPTSSSTSSIPGTILAEPTKECNSEGDGPEQSDTAKLLFKDPKPYTFLAFSLVFSTPSVESFT